jgi:hypothetical protein
MEPIILTLDPTGYVHRRLRIQGVLFALLGLINLVQAYLVDNDFRFVNLIVGIFFISSAFAYPLIFRQKLATFDDNGLMWSVKNRRNLSLAWNQIAYIEASTLHFYVHPNDSGQFTIDLGNLTYEQHKTLKPQIIDLARSKGVDVRMI